MSGHLLRCPNAECQASAAGTKFASGTRPDCPKCGSKLVPISESASDAPRQVTLVPERAKRVEHRAQFFTPTLGAPEVGTVFAGRYNIVKELGRGGMGAVYLVHDNDLDRDVALKVPNLSGADDSFAKRFQREARVGAQLGDISSICRVFDVNQFEGAPYLTMEYIKGESLSDLLKRNGSGLPVRDVVTHLHTLAKVLGEAHSRGIIHRDLKPSNIMIRDDATPVLMDFGLARRESDERMTTGAIGTPAYMSPEQALGDNQNISPATDVYSLGVILYELLTGRTPFQGRKVREVLQKIVHENPAPPSTHRPDLDPMLDAICLKALAKLPAARFSDMAELADEFARFLKEADSPKAKPDLAEPPPLVPDTAHDRPTSLHRLPISRITLVAATVGAGVLMGGLFLYFIRTSPSAPAAAPGPNANRSSRPEAAKGPANDRPVSRPALSPVGPPTAVAPALPAPAVNIKLVDDFTGMTFVAIPPGEFSMGSPGAEEPADEHPAHRVRIQRPFLLGKYEVTQAEYTKVTSDSPSHFTGNGRHPVERVSWLDAVRFCNVLSVKSNDNLTPFYKIENDVVTVIDWDGTGYRLPTEAEWEYACRAGLSGKFGFADDEAGLEDRAWFSESLPPNGPSSTQPIGGKNPNAFGLCDMQGNVWEWCWDWYAEKYVPGESVIDPTGPASGKYRVLRGGHYHSPASNLRCAVRNPDVPITSKSQVNGFRVARNLRRP
jgi:eukaryotic-like serine/threonine-protein kinase